MANRHRGDVPFSFNGKTISLRLTLGSLAELEDAFGSEGLQALSQRLQNGRLSARDICHVLAAGFHGAGDTINALDLGQQIPASALEHAAVAATHLLDVTFGGGRPSRPRLPQPT
jgi:Phage tail tube protein, GTA-gp10